MTFFNQYTLFVYQTGLGQNIFIAIFYTITAVFPHWFGSFSKTEITFSKHSTSLAVLKFNTT